MVRSIRNGLLAVALLGGIEVASVPAEAMPVGDLAKAAMPVTAGETAPIVAAHWGWHHRHWGWWHRW